MLQVSYLGIDSPVPTAKATEASESVVSLVTSEAPQLLVMSVASISPRVMIPLVPAAVLAKGRIGAPLRVAIASLTVGLTLDDRLFHDLSDVAVFVLMLIFGL